MNITPSGVYTLMLSLRETQFSLLIDIHTLQKLKPDFLMKYYYQDFLTPITRKQRRQESQEDLRPESNSWNASENNKEKLYSNLRENRSSNRADLGQNSAGTTSSAELNKLSSEPNSRISRKWMI